MEEPVFGNRLHIEVKKGETCWFRLLGESPRPETWFHVIGGNASKEGLTADLQALKGSVKSPPPQMADGV